MEHRGHWVSNASVNRCAQRAGLVLHLKLLAAVQNCLLDMEHHFGDIVRAHEIHPSRSSWDPRLMMGSGHEIRKPLRAHLQQCATSHQQIHCSQHDCCRCLLPAFSSVERWAGTQHDQTFGCFQRKYHFQLSWFLT